MNKPATIDYARQLRKKSTPAEKLLWQRLRNRKLEGFKFLRQYPIRVSIMNHTEFYIADFCCCEMKLIIELDGEIHDRQIECDVLRERELHNSNYEIIRFNNSDVLNNMDDVENRIILSLKSI
jgi:very-short-patch-repair endonuclease